MSLVSLPLLLLSDKEVAVVADVSVLPNFISDAAAAAAVAVTNMATTVTICMLIYYMYQYAVLDVEELLLVCAVTVVMALTI